MRIQPRATVQGTKETGIPRSRNTVVQWIRNILHKKQRYTPVFFVHKHDPLLVERTYVIRLYVSTDDRQSLLDRVDWWYFRFRPFFPPLSFSFFSLFEEKRVGLEESFFKCINFLSYYFYNWKIVSIFFLISKKKFRLSGQLHLRYIFFLLEFRINDWILEMKI